jgi:hypothetical protein
MNRITLAQVRDRVAQVLGICSDHADVARYVNAAQERLCYKDNWVGTIYRYRVCTSADACLVWPRQIETILAYAVCGGPGTVRSGFWEFQNHAFGLVGGDSCLGATLVDRPRTPTQDTIVGIDKNVRVVADVTEDAEAVLTVQGYDEDANWVRTQVDGEWIDGEQVAISTAGAISTNLFSQITGIIKPVTNGVVRLYEYLAVTAVSRIIGIYEPDETHPDYRASLVPGLGTGIDDDDECTGRWVTVLAKLRPMPVSAANDWLLLGNAEAIKLQVMAIRKEESNLIEEAMVYEARAVALLQEELSSFQGDGMVPTVRVQREWIGDGVYNAI